MSQVSLFLVVYLKYLLHSEAQSTPTGFTKSDIYVEKDNQIMFFF